MLPASFLADFSLENRLPFRLGVILPALAAIVLAVASTLAWELLSFGGAALLGSLVLIFTLGLVLGRALSRPAHRRAQPVLPVAPKHRPVRPAYYQPQEIRCNPFFELL
ncbi:hypothetical protein [Hymenobacter cellulosivorans]|uniref:Uncharacterized protein n=1 Tax=Hymenobacter cellulosivorans TaxID=2932249 RepID=A0ABY4FDE3_9BACT|nr:hypothetical protein [Hymenobacter cellulosivorans]UOQ54697.1 hypothetical protein MUN80_08050 [Hymenobacter cellulosivorans]